MHGDDAKTHRIAIFGKRCNPTYDIAQPIEFRQILVLENLRKEGDGSRASRSINFTGQATFWAA